MTAWSAADRGTEGGRRPPPDDGAEPGALDAPGTGTGDGRRAADDRSGGSGGSGGSGRDGGEPPDEEVGDTGLLPVVPPPPLDVPDHETETTGRPKRHAATRRTGRRYAIAALLGIVVLGVAVAEVGDVVMPSSEPSGSERDIEAGDSPSADESEATEDGTDGPSDSASPDSATPSDSPADTESGDPSESPSEDGEESEPPVEEEGSVETGPGSSTPPPDDDSSPPPPTGSEQPDPPSPTPPDEEEEEEDDCFLFICV
ncbi:hypothetical protein [Streptomyces sp. SBT349]|uniref:hypothetical protein n=1 Tax=Streptomyces sp. SBT349 TaxID=1580539 RepID=UPI00066D9B29|nr:hypothetical protein [Streptomyces sp. SBT349]